MSHLSKKDRAELIAALAAALPLYVDTVADRRRFAATLADRLALPFPDHFVEACVASSDHDN